MIFSANLACPPFFPSRFVSSTILNPSGERCFLSPLLRQAQQGSLLAPPFSPPRNVCSSKSNGDLSIHPVPHLHQDILAYTQSPLRNSLVNVLSHLPPCRTERCLPIFPATHLLTILIVPFPYFRPDTRGENERPVQAPRRRQIRNPNGNQKGLLSTRQEISSRPEQRPQSPRKICRNPKCL